MWSEKDIFYLITGYLMSNFGSFFDFSTADVKIFFPIYYVNKSTSLRVFFIDGFMFEYIKAKNV